MIPILSNKRAILWILLISIPFYLGLGAVHLFDWDEINFAESAREMLLSHDFMTVQIGFEAFWEKPPLFFWLQSLSMALFGVTEFAARLPNAICGTITLLVLYQLGNKIKNQSFGLIWAAIYLAALLPNFYFKFGIIDPVFNLFIFSSIFTLIEAENESVKSSFKYGIFAGLLNGLAVLTKGPVGFLLFLLTFVIYQIVTKFQKFPSYRLFVGFALAFALIVGTWFGLNIYFNGWEIFQHFIQYQIDLFTQPVAGHKQPFYYHFILVLLGCFPMSFMALPALRSSNHIATNLKTIRIWMLSLFWIVMILFTITTTKIAHYSSMAYLPLSFLAAAFMHSCIDSKQAAPKWMRNILFGFGLVLGALWFSVPFIFQNKSSWIHLLSKDQFAFDSFNIEVNWPVWISIFGLIMIGLCFLAFKSAKRQNWVSFLVSLGGFSSIAMLSLFFFILPRIEEYTQGPAIEFLQQKAGNKVYVATQGYKSYTNYFYFQFPNSTNKELDHADYLLDHPQDQPVFIITKSNFQAAKDNPLLKFLYQKGGFRFYEKVDSK
ncbi:MAG: glycosyltransferase family 39 protein [Saprospiraceae bacterium]